MWYGERSCFVGRAFLEGPYGRDEGDHPWETRNRVACAGPVSIVCVGNACRGDGGCRCGRLCWPHGRVGPIVTPIMGFMPMSIQCSRGGGSVGIVSGTEGGLRASVGGLGSRLSIGCGVGTFPCCGVVRSGWYRGLMTIWGCGWSCGIIVWGPMWDVIHGLFGLAQWRRPVGGVEHRRPMWRRSRIGGPRASCIVCPIRAGKAGPAGSPSSGRKEPSWTSAVTRVPCTKGGLRTPLFILYISVRSLEGNKSVCNYIRFEGGRPILSAPHVCSPEDVNTKHGVPGSGRWISLFGSACYVWGVSCVPLCPRYF